VQRRQADPEDLAYVQQMPHVAPAEPLARRTGAPVLQRPVVQPVDRRAHRIATAAGEHRPVPRQPCRHHAVEHVHAQRHRLGHLPELADAHQVARPFPRQQVRSHAHTRHDQVLRLAHADPADGIAIERAQRQQALGAALPQFRVDAALDNAEYQLPRGTGLLGTLSRPR